MPLPQIPLDDPRVLAWPKSASSPTWEELTDTERGSLPGARNYLESAINTGLVPEVELIRNGPARVPGQHQPRDRATGHGPSGTTERSLA